MKALKENRVAAPRCKTVFSEEEHTFVKHSIIVCDFGSRVTTSDLRFILKSYLDATGRKEPRFFSNWEKLAVNFLNMIKLCAHVSVVIFKETELQSMKLLLMPKLTAC
jgi:hypothetical protein